MKKKVVLFIFSIVILIVNFSILVSADSENPIKVIFNGKELNMADPPFVESNRILVPLRTIFEALEIKIDWDAYTKTIIANNADKSIKIQIGNNIAIVDGKEKNLDVPAKIINSKTFVPLRFIIENLGAEIEWENTTKSVLIKYIKPSPIPTITPTPSPKPTPTPTLTPTPSPIPIPEKLTLKDIVKKNQSLVIIKTFDERGIEIGSGSGFISSSDGKIITNFHVIDYASYVQVTDINNRVLNIDGILAYDVARDIAVISVSNITNIPPVSLGNSDKVEIGDEVVAIGSPLGLQNTISTGIISNFTTIENKKFIQTTAAISPGSSGGALFNMDGDVIGITTATFTEGQNINLVIPINDEIPLLNTSAKLKSMEQVNLENHPPKIFNHIGVQPTYGQI